MNKMHILPPSPNCCQICGVNHVPEDPHDPESLYYQMSFYLKHNRFPTWEDAMAHCTGLMKDLWRNEIKNILKERGKTHENKPNFDGRGTD